MNKAAEGFIRKQHSSDSTRFKAVAEKSLWFNIMKRRRRQHNKETETRRERVSAFSSTLLQTQDSERRLRRPADRQVTDAQVTDRQVTDRQVIDAQVTWRWTDESM